MKEMSTIKFPNHTEAYEIVDAAARIDIEELRALVGDTSVSEQINAAIAALPNLEEVQF